MLVAVSRLVRLGVLLTIQFKDWMKRLAVMASPFDLIDNKPPTLVIMVFGRNNLIKVDGVSNPRNTDHIDLHGFWKLIKATSIN